MQRASFILVILGLLAAPGIGQQAASESVSNDKGEPFVVPGLVSIESPHPTLEWRSSKTFESEVTTAHYFICSNNDESTPLILVIDERAAKEDIQRQTLAFENYKVARQFAENHGFKVQKGKAPDVKKAKKNRVMYSVVGEHTHQVDGQGNKMQMYIGGMTIFSDHRTYTLQAMAPNAESTKILLGAAKTLKELLPTEQVSLNR